MGNPNNTNIVDKEISLIECNDDYDSDFWNSGKRIYCPDFHDNDFLFGDQYTN